MSAQEFRHPELVEQVLAAVEDAGAAAALLKFELTESLGPANVVLQTWPGHSPAQQTLFRQGQRRGRAREHQGVAFGQYRSVAHAERVAIAVAQIDHMNP